jgi:hypothetical protein
MAQCEHEFILEKHSKQVKCVKCGIFDDEMELPNKALDSKEERDEFYKTQINFE